MNLTMKGLIVNFSSSALRRPALIVIDVQRGFDDGQYWGQRDNPECEANITALLSRWRDLSWPVVFVQHDSNTPSSPLAPGTNGHEFKKEITGVPDLLIHKRVNSSFYGTPDLDAWLRAESIDEVVICGITTNHCCETTARVGGNLGHHVLLALDATHTFDRRAPDGTVVSADHLALVTATNLHREFATVVSTQQLLSVDRAVAGS